MWRAGDLELRAAIRRGRDRLIAAGVEPGEAALDAELLAREALDWDRATLVARLADAAPDGLEPRFSALLARRAVREPMAYILGRQEFWGRDFAVGPGVLIPRPETELLVEEALAWARGRESRSPIRAVDVGTGSGCLAITLALELGQAEVHATDISADALAVARRNAARLAAPVVFHHGALLADVAPPVDLMVANPPYIPAGEYEGLPPEVRGFEPRSALVGGADGLDVVRQVVQAAGAALAPGGRLLMEIGFGQAADARRMVPDGESLLLLHVRDDLQGIPRVVVAERRRESATASG
jgi:release factor glutamine methyltransferase